MLKEMQHGNFGSGSSQSALELPFEVERHSIETRAMGLKSRARIFMKWFHKARSSIFSCMGFQSVIDTKPTTIYCGSWATRFQFWLANGANNSCS